MIDIHSHILPGLDDGASNLNEAIKMAKNAVADGIQELIATPHTYNGIYQNSYQRVLESVNLLKNELNNLQIPLKIYAGSEIHIHQELLDNVKRKKVMTLANSHKYVLIELPNLSVPLFTETILQQLLSEGYKPIIAHPERCIFIQNNPMTFEHWIRMGVMSQITAGSLKGKWGKRVQKISKMMVKNNLVHFIGSDGHNSITRTVEIKEAFRIIGKLTNKMMVEQLTDNSRAILRDGKLVD